MATTVFKDAAAASSTVAITLASLASASTLTTGRMSDAIDNRTNLYKNYRIGGQIMSGSSPTDGKRIEVWCYPAINDTPTYLDAFSGGADAAATAASRNILATYCRLVAGIVTDATSNCAYPFENDLASIFGGWIPLAFGLFVTQSTGAALNATAGNHFIYATGLYETGA